MKIGVTAPGSSTNMFVNILLAKAGFKPEAVAIIGVGAAAGAVAIMKRGEHRRDLQSRPGDIDDSNRAGAIVAVSTRAPTRAHAGRLRRRLPGRLIYASQDFIEKYPNTAQAIVNAMVRALRFIAEVDTRPDRRSGPPSTTAKTRRSTRRR